MTGRVLVVAYFFPPVVSVGVERTLSFVTHLPENGWTPVVVGPARSAYRSVDPASVSRIPELTEVWRAGSFEPGHVRRAARRLLGGMRAGRGQAPGREAGGRTGLRDRLNAAWAWAVPLLFFPDEQVLWTPGAVAAGRRAHRREAVDAIFSTSPPISGHLAAAALKRLTGAPWIADFRDPWIGNVFARPLPAAHRAMQRALERMIVRRADRVVFASARVRDSYAQRYPRLADRFSLIRNGYDRAELEAAKPATFAGGRLGAEEPGIFRLVYAGSVHGRRELPIFLDGLEIALGRDPGLPERLRVDFVGYFSVENRRVAERRFRALAPVVRHLGLRPRTEALARLRGADAALYLLPNAPGAELAIGSKLYEYIGLDKPILAVTPPGEARELLADLDWGTVADATPEGVADGVRRLLAAPSPDRSADPEDRFERRTLTRQLAVLLDEVAGSERADRQGVDQ